MSEQQLAPKHLLVDLDGTILGNRNLSLSVDFARRAIGALKKYGGVRKAARVLMAINSEFGKPSPEVTNDKRVVALFSEQMGLSLDEARGVLRDGVSLIFPSLEKHFYPMPGAREFLDWAKERYTLTLATNPVWPPEIVELRVRWAGVDPKIFRSMTHIREMHACKPTLAYYEEILEKNSFDASDCLLIGNEIKMDLPATRAGIPVFIVGAYKKLAHLKPAKAKAPAWRGTFGQLRELLESTEGVGAGS